MSTAKRPYLEHAKLTSFGAFSNRVVGPFAPGLNVVFGRNEAGKTTLASFVDGVLFGWEEARGNRNTYKPAAAERAGSLFFAVPDGETPGENADAERREPDVSRETMNADNVVSRETTGSDQPAPRGTTRTVELSRARNADGLQGCTELVADIDRETFRTMFSLTSDELRSLRNTTDVTARLLTAGSGTESSPAQVLAQVQERLATYTSRAAGIEHSLVNLSAEQDDLREQMARAVDEAERLKREDKEFAELKPQRTDLLSRLDAVNADIEQLVARREQADKALAERERTLAQITGIRAQEDELAAERLHAAPAAPRMLLRLSSSEERALRDQIDALAAEEAKCDHAVDLAQDNYATSKASYEALMETEDAAALTGRRRRTRTTQVALSVLLPAVFVTAGVPLFVHGREITSLSFTALGIGLVAMAVIMACAALAMLLRPDKEAEAKEARVQDARWVMLQDRKKLEVCQRAREEYRARAQAALAEAGLSDAGHSLRRARMLLDDAKDARADEASYRQHKQALSSRRLDLEDQLSQLDAQWERVFDHPALREIGEQTPEAIDEVIAQKTHQRAGLVRASERLNRRYGELKQELSQARGQRGFDELKLRYEEVRTRMDESARDYARLLLARRMLEAAIDTWELKSQPEVYRQASRLLADMTQGRWVKVELADDGRVVVEDAVKTRLDPVRLSLGTCQQLYLSLRIALLMEAESVGRAVPILADDILVNFDTPRRAGAARALAELARTRQVILFTCHEEIVETMRAADPNLNEVHI